MIARLSLATLLTLLMFTGVACEKEIHEVRLDRVPQEGPVRWATVASDER
jgi:hypothetical protein